MEIKSEVNHFNISKICRSCLIEKNIMKAIFAPDESTGQSVAERIMGFTNIQLEIGDGLPSLICIDCVHQADRAFSFKKLCEQSDTNLRQFLERPPIGVDIKKEEEEVETADYGLVDNLGLDDFSHNDEQDEDNKDFSILMESVNPPDIKQEEIESTDYEIVGGSINNLELEDASNKWDKKEDGDIKQEEKIIIKQHLRTHTSSFPCEFCQKIYTRKADLNRHMLTHRNEKPFECNICHKRFTLAGNLKAHMMIHRNERPFECNVCQKRFTHASSLRPHMRTHTKEKPYECDICQKRFTIMASLKSHIMMHKNEKPFECNICQKRFTHPSNLKPHMRTHTNERPFECNICQKRFRHSCNLKTHMMTHKNERSFECNICQKRFTHPFSFKRHVGTHTNKRRVECNICQKECQH